MSAPSRALSYVLAATAIIFSPRFSSSSEKFQFTLHCR